MTVIANEGENFRTRNARVKRAKTRGRILAAAFALFEERGIDATTIDDVRHAAHLSRGSIYNYFPTFDAMLREMAQHMVIQLNHGNRLPSSAAEPDRAHLLQRSLFDPADFLRSRRR